MMLLFILISEQNVGLMLSLSMRKSMGSGKMSSDTILSSDLSIHSWLLALNLWLFFKIMGLMCTSMDKDWSRVMLFLRREEPKERILTMTKSASLNLTKWLPSIHKRMVEEVISSNLYKLFEVLLKLRVRSGIVPSKHVYLAESKS